MSQQAVAGFELQPDQTRLTTVIRIANALGLELRLELIEGPK